MHGVGERARLGEHGGDGVGPRRPARGAISSTSAEPTTAASATRAMAAARSGVRMPKPTATGRPVAARMRATAGATAASSASSVPVTPATET